MCYHLPGVILKMARPINEDAEGIQVESAQEAARKPPIRNNVIKEDGYVQIIATVSCTLTSRLANLLQIVGFKCDC